MISKKTQIIFLTYNLTELKMFIDLHCLVIIGTINIVINDKNNNVGIQCFGCSIAIGSASVRQPVRFNSAHLLFALDWTGATRA